MNAKRPPARRALDIAKQDEGTTAATRTLAECEAVLERGLKTFIEVGQALLEIRDRRLYRESHATFEEYCRERWGWTRQHANRQVAAAKTAKVLEPTGSIPTSERQARELAPLGEKPEQMQQAWTEVAAGLGGTAATAKQVRDAVEKKRPEPGPSRLADLQAKNAKALKAHARAAETPEANPELEKLDEIAREIREGEKAKGGASKPGHRPKSQDDPDEQVLDTICRGIDHLVLKQDTERLDRIRDYWKRRVPAAGELGS